MELNLRVNEYPIILNQELNKIELKKYNFKKAGLFIRLLLKPKRNDTIWWLKNCDLKYFNDDINNWIMPILEARAGVEIMFGTSAFLWYRENRLIQFTFQIIENKRMAQRCLEKFEEELIKIIGKPTSSNPPIRIWETKSQKCILEYPHGKEGYIHLMTKDQ